MNWNISAWSIRQPVPSLVLFMVLIALGYVSFGQLPVTRFPNIDVPIVQVRVYQSGAAPSELEVQVTKKIEDAIAGVNGVKHQTSAITEGSSVTTIEFRLEVNQDRAVNDVKDAIARIRSELPRTIEEPIITRVQTSSEAFGPDHHPDLPDLICVFRTDLGMLERCESPAVGLVDVPIYHPHAPRSGDHTVNSQLWVSGPDIVGTPENGRANVLDIAPTILDALDVALPEWLDGCPLPVSAAAQEPRLAHDGVTPSALSAAD